MFTKTSSVTNDTLIDITSGSSTQIANCKIINTSADSNPSLNSTCVLINNFSSLSNCDVIAAQNLLVSPGQVTCVIVGPNSGLVNCFISGAGCVPVPDYGLNMSGSSSVVFSVGNTISNVKRGIAISNTSNSVIHNNTVSNCSVVAMTIYGFFGSASALVSDCIFCNSAVGLSLGSGASYNGHSFMNNCRFFGNTNNFSFSSGSLITADNSIEWATLITGDSGTGSDQEFVSAGSNNQFGMCLKPQALSVGSSTFGGNIGALQIGSGPTNHMYPVEKGRGNRRDELPNQ